MKIYNIYKFYIPFLNSMPVDNPTITLNKNDKFFICLGNQGMHSFVMLGVYDQGVPTILARVGKQGVLSPEDKGRTDCSIGSNFVCNALFSHTNAAFRGENLNLNGDFRYSAYDINYLQYLQFIRLLRLNQKKSKFNLNCFQPEEELEANKIKLKLKPVLEEDESSFSTEEIDIIERSSKLSIGNTCRHSALDLIEYTQHSSSIRDVQSSLFFKRSSLIADFENGKPNQFFYVFPLPPTAYECDTEKKLVLKKIYNRMENLIKKDPNGDNTIEKFNVLKSLYIEQAGIPEGNILDALNSIMEWKSTNNDVISQLRAQSFLGKLFVSQSATSKMVDDLEHMLSDRNSGCLAC